MHVDYTLVLDREQLRDITLNDEELMREVLVTLIDDTAIQMVALGKAIGGQDPEKCKQLAHYCKGACANVGANRAAAVLTRMEREAAAMEFGQCSATLRALGEEMESLCVEAGSLD